MGNQKRARGFAIARWAQIQSVSKKEGGCYKPMSRPHMQGVLPYHLQAEAPRLKERSLVSRIAVGALCLACCGGMIVLFATIYSFWFPDALFGTPVASHPQPMHDLHAAGAAAHTFVSVHGAAPAPHQRTKIQRSVVQRLSMLKRAPNGKGVDLPWAFALFPHWKAPGATPEEDGFETNAVLSDLILAISYLCQGELDD